MIRRAGDGDRRAVRAPVRPRGDVPAPGQHRVRDARREGNRDPRRLVACEARTVGVRVGADAIDRSAVEPEVAGDWCKARDLRVYRDGKRAERGGVTPGDPHARVCGRHGAVEGRQVVERVLAALGRVPLDRDSMSVASGESQAAEPHPVGDRVALVVVSLAGAQVAVDPLGWITGRIGGRARRSIGALVEISRGVRGQN